MEKISKSNQFCLDLLQLDVSSPKALANTVMSLASNLRAHSPVELSDSPVFHYQNTSMSKSVAGIAASLESRTLQATDVQHLCNLHVSQAMMDQPMLYLQTDATPVRHPHSPTLEGRTYIYVPNNVIPGNKPLSTGYQVSAIHVGEAQSHWSLPLSMRRVEVEQSAGECAVQQIEQLLSPGGILPFREGQKVLNNADTGYAHPGFVAPLHRHDSLVNIVRLRNGSGAWKPDPQLDTGGAPRIYSEDALYLRLKTQQFMYKSKGETHAKLQPALGEQTPDEEIELEQTTAKGRPLRIRLRRWNDKMWRSQKGHNMHNKPFDVLCATVSDARTGKPLFDKPLWIGVFGVRKSEVPTETAYDSYRHRYDVEPAFRFEKQGLMLEKYQPSDTRHFDNWLLVVMLSFWLLFAASDEVTYIPKKWRQYPKGEAEKKRFQTKRWSPAQAQKAALWLFLTFDPAPFLPKKCKKGKGRQKGDLQTPRPRFIVMKKPKRKSKKSLKVELKE